MVAGRQTIYTHPGTSAETRLLTLRVRMQIVRHAEALERLSDLHGSSVNSRQLRRAGSGPWSDARMMAKSNAGVRLIRLMEHPTIPLA